MESAFSKSSGKLYVEVCNHIEYSSRARCDFRKTGQASKLFLCDCHKDKNSVEKDRKKSFDEQKVKTNVETYKRVTSSVLLHERDPKDSLEKSGEPNGQDPGTQKARNKFFLSLCYQYGAGVEQDKKNAVALYKKGSSVKNIYGTFSLSSCYEHSVWVNKDV